MIETIDKALIYYINLNVRNNGHGILNGYLSLTSDLDSSVFDYWVTHIGNNDINTTEYTFCFNLKNYLFNFLNYNDINDENIEKAYDRLIINQFIEPHDNFKFDVKLTDKGLNHLYNTTIHENIIYQNEFYSYFISHILLSDNKFNLDKHYLIFKDFSIKKIDNLITSFSDKEDYKNAEKMKKIKDKL